MLKNRNFSQFEPILRTMAKDFSEFIVAPVRLSRAGITTLACGSFLDQSCQFIQTGARARSTRKMAPFSQVVKCQISSKSHLFKELKNTPTFTVTPCLQNDTTNADFAYTES